MSQSKEALAVSAKAEAASKLDQQIRRRIETVRKHWIFMARDLHQFTDREMWKALGYASLSEWMADPEVELNERTVYQLTSIWRELVVNKGVKPAELEGMGWDKVLRVIPVVRRGLAPAEEALADCRALSISDLRIKYEGRVKSEPAQDKLEATREAPLVQCDKCQNWYRPTKEKA